MTDYICQLNQECHVWDTMPEYKGCLFHNKKLGYIKGVRSGKCPMTPEKVRDNLKVE